MPSLLKTFIIYIFDLSIKSWLTKKKFHAIGAGLIVKLLKIINKSSTFESRVTRQLGKSSLLEQISDYPNIFKPNIRCPKWKSLAGFWGETAAAACRWEWPCSEGSATCRGPPSGTPSKTPSGPAGRTKWRKWSGPDFPAGCTTSAPRPRCWPWSLWAWKWTPEGGRVGRDDGLRRVRRWERWDGGSAGRSWEKWGTEENGGRVCAELRSFWVLWRVLTVSGGTSSEDSHLKICKL